MSSLHEKHDHHSAPGHLGRIRMLSSLALSKPAAGPGCWPIDCPGSQMIDGVEKAMIQRIAATTAALWRRAGEIRRVRPQLE